MNSSIDHRRARRQFIKSGFAPGAAGLWRPGLARAAPQAARALPIRRVTIVKHPSGIRVMGWPAERVVVKDSRHLGDKPGKLINEANADLANHTNYEVIPPTRK